MKTGILSLLAAVGLSLSLGGGTASAQSITLTGPDRSGFIENHSYDITWQADGVQSVSVLAYGDRTPLGTKSRGDFHYVIAEGVPASQGSASWQTPWIDAANFTIKVKGYNSEGKLVDADERRYNFRPDSMENRTADGIYIDLSDKNRQRIYVQRDGEITRAYLTTSSSNYNFRPPGSHPKAPHEHLGVFDIKSKEKNHWSTLYDVNMEYAMRYHGGHYVHGTDRDLYDELGSPASHGCNRMTQHDARELYSMTSIGDRVEVIGPSG